MRIIAIAWLVLFGLGCATTERRISYEPSGESGESIAVPDPDGAWVQTRRRACGITVSTTEEPVKTRADAADDAIVRFLVYIACASAVLVLLGLAAGYLHAAGKIPCPWWDELLMIALLTLGAALLTIRWYGLLPWIFAGALVAYISYRLIKRHRAARTEE